MKGYLLLIFFVFSVCHLKADTEQIKENSDNTQAIEIQKKRIDNKRKSKQDAIEADKKKIEWGSQIRNYVLHPYKMIKDVRSSFESSNADHVLDGNLSPFLKAYLMFMAQKKDTETSLL